MRIPDAVYRIQFEPSFGFEDGLGLLDYLKNLGISDIYSSPVFKSRPGSPHGYDVVDPTAINEELGGENKLIELIHLARDKGLGWIQDIVPNHMAVDRQNTWLMDVLENGPESRYYRYFDIYWDHYYEGIKDRLLIPFLGAFYGETLEKGEIALDYTEEGFIVAYYDKKFPLRLESYRRILDKDIGSLEKSLGRDDPDFIEFLGAIQTLYNLPSNNLDYRHRQIQFGKHKLREMYNRNDKIRGYVDTCLKKINGDSKNPRSFDSLDDILGEQFFRLSFWKVASEEINYRRFFTINDLISIRNESKEVFNHTHSLITRFVNEGLFTGLRIDHVDGLYDPYGYLSALRESAPDTYLVVEKILDAGELLPGEWPVQGNSGYDALNMINNLFCKRSNKTPFQQIYNRFTRGQSNFKELVAEKKRLIANHYLAGDIDNLAHTLKRISANNRHGNDIALFGLRRALVKIMSWFPVYRTYIRGNEISDSDRKYITEAVEKAISYSPDLSYELRFIEKFLLIQFDDLCDDKDRRKMADFSNRFQQITGPLMAKGFEDTVLYSYNRLLSLNEVGGNPERFGVEREQFHNFCITQMRQFPHSMVTLTTHDTKRSEDVRARINVLSEIPVIWNEKVKSWMKLNRGLKSRTRGREIPDKNDEYALYQTLIGSYPFTREELPGYIKRIKRYIIKAVREAKAHTAWIKPDEEYENGFVDFIDKILKPEEDTPFLKEFLPFQGESAFYGIFNSLSQTLIKLTIPGVPDFYQGSELWDLRLVDPDNRGPVDFKKRSEYLSSLKLTGSDAKPNLLEDLLNNAHDGRIKMYAIFNTLHFRRSAGQLFTDGNYIPLKVTGDKSDNVIAFCRNYNDMWALTIVPRFLTSLVSPDKQPLGKSVWGDTQIEIVENMPLKWRNIFTNATVDSNNVIYVGDILANFPVALLTGEPDA
jgi:(1->4)-alpha-D-glucan 1-alpha-D-glucosylmutase